MIPSTGRTDPAVSELRELRQGTSPGWEVPRQAMMVEYAAGFDPCKFFHSSTPVIFH
jgi:hypothetical protein